MNLCLWAPLVVLSPALHAGFVYSGLRDIPIPATFDGVYLDLDAGTVSFSPFQGWDLNPFFGGQGISNNADFQPLRVGSGNLDAILNLPALTSVNSFSQSFSTGEGGSALNHIGSGPFQFQTDQVGYVGFRFIANGGDAPLYGWMRVVFTNNTAGALIRDWTYRDDGGPIFTGTAIPEANQALLPSLAGIALGVWCFRRSRFRQAGRR